MIPYFPLERRVASPVSRRSQEIGSPTWTRTTIDRLTAGRPAIGRSGMNLVDHRVIETRPPVCRTGVLPLSLMAQSLTTNGASSWFRATLSAASAQRFHQISLRGKWRGLRESNTLRRMALRH
jgi:hypothetical protein